MFDPRIALSGGDGERAFACVVECGYENPYTYSHNQFDALIFPAAELTQFCIDV